MAQPAAAAGDAAAALRSNWRKVSSTDNLQAFADDGSYVHSSGSGGTRSRLTGLAMLALAVVLLAAELLVVASKALPAPQLRLLQTLAADSYYVYLLPLMVPLAVIAVTANWFSLKLFKHNS